MPQVLLICPPPTAAPLPPIFTDDFDGAVEKSRHLAQHFQKIAEDTGVHFLNAGDVIESSPVDGIHLEVDAHRKFGMVVADKVRAILA